MQHMLITMDTTDTLLMVLVILLSVAMIVSLVVVITVGIMLRRVLKTATLIAQTSNQTILLIKQRLQSKLGLLTTIKTIIKQK